MGFYRHFSWNSLSDIPQDSVWDYFRKSLILRSRVFDRYFSCDSVMSRISPKNISVIPLRSPPNIPLLIPPGVLLGIPSWILSAMFLAGIPSLFSLEIPFGRFNPWILTSLRQQFLQDSFWDFSRDSFCGSSQVSFRDSCINFNRNFFLDLSQVSLLLMILPQNFFGVFYGIPSSISRFLLVFF